MDHNPPGSSVNGIFDKNSCLQARIPEWVTLPAPWDFLNLGIEPESLATPALAGGFFTTSTTWEAPGLPQNTRKILNEEQMKP